MPADGSRRDAAPLFRDRARASSFGANAELYDRSRPRYPDALIDDLMAPSPPMVLDVGCGTGLFGRSFVERGTPVLGVEPDAMMAD
ncbi:MAG TPA: methyltransferase domain-containing protein, partial [Acidimicrobiales bacterium]|nr:methyltransferase domain-containing protein [Acidimicrobiales bacterium]